MHRLDVSEAMQQKGVKETTIRSSGSPYKGEHNESEPMTDDARNHLQARADAVYEQFVGDLARFRGASVEHVREHFGKGRSLDAKSAVSAGMVDRVDTLQNTIYKLAAGRVRIARGEKVQDEWDAPTPSEQRQNSLRERAGRFS